MFYPQNKIIIVDDKLEHLNILSRPFYENGIGCKCFEYDIAYANPLKGVRIAFFDIRITPGAGSSQKKLNDVATAIKQYIHIDNGPFALIFWTSNKQEIDDIKRYIHERHTDCPKPFVVDFIDKDEFLDKVHELQNKVEAVLNDQTLKLLFEFENLASVSAANTINQVYEIIPRNDAWGETANFKENFEKVFSKIAVNNLGYSYAKHDPKKGVLGSMLPVLNHHIDTSTNIGDWKSYLTTLANSKNYNDVKYPLNFSVGKLNAIFHIEKSNGDKEARGAVIEIDKNNTDLLKSLNIDNVDSCFNSLIPFKSDKRAEKIRVRSNSKLVAVEISASCDFANNKKRLNKYILGFITPEIDFKEWVNDDIRAESSYNVGGANFHFNGNDFQIWLNLNFVFGVKGDNPGLGVPLFVLKKEIMDMIGNKYANHISRIGITSF